MQTQKPAPRRCASHPAEKINFMCTLQACQHYMRPGCRLCRNQLHSSHMRKVFSIEDLVSSLRCFLIQKQNLLPESPAYKRNLRDKISLMRQFRLNLEEEERNLVQADLLYDNCREQIEKVRVRFKEIRLAQKKMQQQATAVQLQQICRVLVSALSFNAKGVFEFNREQAEAFGALVKQIKEIESQAVTSLYRCEEYVQKVADVLASNDFSQIQENDWTVLKKETLSTRKLNLTKHIVLRQSVLCTKPESVDCQVETVVEGRDMVRQLQQRIKQLQTQVQEGKVALMKSEETIQINQYDHQIMLRKMKQFRKKYEQSLKKVVKTVDLKEGACQTNNQVIKEDGLSQTTETGSQSEAEAGSQRGSPGSRRGEQGRIECAKGEGEVEREQFERTRMRFFKPAQQFEVTRKGWFSRR